MSRQLSWKRNALWAGAYLVILVILVPLSYLLPSQGFMQSDVDESQIVLDQSIDVVERVSSVEEPDQIEGIYKNKTQTFKLDTNFLTLDESATHGNYLIFIKRKGVDDGEIEVSSYATERFVGGANLAKNILPSPPNISLKNGRLFINAPERLNLEFKVFMADFTVDQFKHVNQNSFDSYRSPSMWKIIYLQVPQSVEIYNSNTYNVHIL